MKEITDRISLRPAEARDEEFWRETFFDSIRPHFASLNLPEAQLNQLLEMQYQGQTTDYRANYPQAENDVILFDGVPVGRVTILIENDVLLIADLAVLSNYQSLGIGSKIIQDCVRQGRQKNIPVRFSVEKSNRALALYEKLGFQIVADLDSHFRMEWKG